MKSQVSGCYVKARVAIYSRHRQHDKNYHVLTEQARFAIDSVLPRCKQIIKNNIVMHLICIKDCLKILL